MSHLDLALNDLSAAVTQFDAAIDGASAMWMTARAPGKWSPSQVVEHVARIMEESAKVAAGTSSKFPTMPSFLRPIVRLMVFHRTVRRKTFPRMTAIPAFDPPPFDGPATPAEGRVRLSGALDQFSRACRDRESFAEDVASTLFGAVSPADFAAFQAMHVRHHLAQMPRR